MPDHIAEMPKGLQCLHVPGTPRWTLHPIDLSACRVLDAGGQHVGTLKSIGGRWKFKAIGYEPDGSVVPGGGPLTDRHNTVFDSPDQAALAAAFAPDDATCGTGTGTGITKAASSS